jgi:hypothetical protein
MPDLRYCVTHKGKTYCWDVERKCPVEVVVRDVPPTQESMAVVGEIISLMVEQQTLAGMPREDR